MDSQKGNYLSQKNSPQKLNQNERQNIFDKIYKRKNLSFKLAQSLGAEYSKI